LRFFAVQAFERFVRCALNRDDARFPFRSAAVRYRLGNTSSRVMSRSFHCDCCLWEIAKVRGSGPDFSKLDCTLDGAAVSACHNDPEDVAFCRWRWTAVRAVADDDENDNHRRFPAPCRRASRAARPWRPAPMLAPGELGGEHPLVVGNLIARGGAFVYQRHGLILSLRPRFALGPFSFENWCYRRSRRRLVGSLLDECLLALVLDFGGASPMRPGQRVETCGKLGLALGAGGTGQRHRPS